MNNDTITRPLGLSQDADLLQHTLMAATVLVIQLVILIYLFTRGVFAFFGFDFKSLGIKIITVLVIGGSLAWLIFAAGIQA